MAETVTCPACGAESYDHEWCDVCGAELAAADASDLPWIDLGAAFALELDGARRLLRVVEVVESYATRRVTLGRLCPAGQEAEHFTQAERAQAGLTLHADPASFDPRAVPEAWPLLLIEESLKEQNLEPDALKESVRHLVHLPIASMDRDAHRTVEILHAPPGAPLQDYLESLGRLLTIEEAAGVTLLLMDAVEAVHDAGLYHFQICPWTVRIAHADELEESRRGEEPLSLTFEGIRGFYDAGADLDSHPVIMGFSPPEFFGRTRGRIDRRVDIFGIGMLFYYLLAGCPPPTGSLTRYVPYVPVRAYRFEIPPGLQRFIDGCCAPTPEQRYPAVSVARTALLECLDAAHRRDPAREDAARELHNERPVSLYTAVDRHIGIGKGRRNPINQDSVFLGHDAGRALALVAVADGVSTSSYGSGDIASAYLVEAAAKLWERRHTLNLRGSGEEASQESEPNGKASGEREGGNGFSAPGRVALTGARSNAPPLDTPPARLLKRLLADANAGVTDYINKRYAPFTGPVHEVMGTTAVLALVQDDLMTVASIGDSRIYLLRDGHMECLTRDHNLATLQIIEGFAPDDALAIPHGKALARCLGTFQIHDGRLDSVPPEPDVATFRVLPGDTILLTTDGLIDFAGPTEHAAEENIRQVLLQEEIPALACLRLILMANEGGGEDNIGVAIIRVTEHHAHTDRLLLTQSFPPPRHHLETR